MMTESHHETNTVPALRPFAIRLAIFYSAVFGLTGVYLPFFPVWLRAIGMDATWVGVIIAVPAVTRFTVLPFITGFAERRGSLRSALIATAWLTTLGFAVLAFAHEPLVVLLVFAATACIWTPMIPLTDGYALKGVLRYGLSYGPLRLWGSAAFIIGALASGALSAIVPAQHLIWLIVAVAVLGAFASFALLPMREATSTGIVSGGATVLLRSPAFWAVMLTTALLQGSHAAYYAFGSIIWQAEGFDGFAIALMWSLGVLAEIVLFALSPRLSIPPILMLTIGALAAMLRWSIAAQGPPAPVLIAIQLLHSLTFGITLLGTVGLLAKLVPGRIMASAQGYLVAATGATSGTAMVLSGLIYARYGVAVYYAMAAMGAAGLAIIIGMRGSLAAAARSQPQSAGAGG